MREPLPHDPYIEAVDQAFTAAGLESDSYRTSDADEFEDDGITPTLSAVVYWTGENPAVDDAETPQGFAVFWSAVTGWQWAPRREDGGNEVPQYLAEVWASPVTVAAALAAALGSPPWIGPTARAVQTAVHKWRTPAEPVNTMTVTVRDRSAEAPWGSGPTDPVIREVTISAHCPSCGQRRGEPQGLCQSDDGVGYWVQVWKNPCGHVDHYTDVVAEARQLAATQIEA